MTNPFSSDFSTDFGEPGAALSAVQASQTVSANASTVIRASISVAEGAQTLSAAGTTPFVALAVLATSQASQTVTAAGNVPLGPDRSNLALTQFPQSISAAGVVDLQFHVGSLSVIQASQILVTPAVATTSPPASTAAPAAVGSMEDMETRLRAVLPLGWFPDDTPVLDGLLAGVSSVWAFLWSLLAYVIQQRRIATATDINLDLIANDFLGQSLPRKSGERDAVYSSRIRASIFQEMGTRKAISDALTRMNGATPKIFEPANASDTGGYGAAGSPINTGLYYNQAGGYGSYDLPFQAFIQTSSPSISTVLGVQGYGSASGNLIVIGGYGVGAMEYSSGLGELLSASDEEVYSVINAVKPVATIMWVSTQATSVQPSGGDQPGAVLDSNFILNVSRLV